MKAAKILASVSFILLAFTLISTPTKASDVPSQLPKPTEVIIPKDEKIVAEKPFYELTEGERDLVERIVMAEAGSEPIDVQIAVAQTILDRVTSRKQTITKVCTAKYQFAKPYPYEVSEKTKDAVFLVFDKGERIFDKVTHFYAWQLIPPPHWVSAKELVGELGKVRFYKDKEN